MLEKISLENFKGFKTLENLKMKPITILCGTNSCGKSSILQSILLLKQTLESKNINQTLLLNGRFVKLGYFQDIIFEKDIENNVIFNFCFKLIKDDFYISRNRSIPIYYILRELAGGNFHRKDLEEYIVHFNFSLKSNKEITDSNDYLKSLTVEKLKVVITTIIENKKELPETSIELNLKKDNIYSVKWKNLDNRVFTSGKSDKKNAEAEAKIIFANLFPISVEYTSKKQIHPSLDLSLYRLTELLQNIFSSYTYLGPLRGEPEREYIYRDEIVEIGNKGENAAYLYLAEKDKEINNHYFYNNLKDSFEAKPKINLKNALKNWFELMNIYNFDAEILNKIIYLNLGSNSSKVTQVSIAEVGFGVSQIFPILLEGLRMPKENTLLLEQPEIHLHPNLQMQMADYFISLALSQKKVIVETHSDHIINRLVRRIVEDDKFNLNDLIGIYFINSTENGSTYEEIKIDDKKGIINWPKDFFDQNALEQEKIIKAGLKKRKIEREKQLK